MATWSISSHLRHSWFIIVRRCEPGETGEF